jgi:uncharacterized OB-fold protein
VPDRPLPVPDDLTRPFWEAAARQELVIQRCDGCGFHAYPPAHLCDRCASATLRYVPVSGRGRIYTLTTNYQKSVAGFEEAVPYVNLVVELDEQPLLLMVSDLAGEETEQVQIGAPVEVHFVPLAEGIWLPQWRLV